MVRFSVPQYRQEVEGETKILGAQDFPIIITIPLGQVREFCFAISIVILCLFAFLFVWSGAGFGVVRWIFLFLFLFLLFMDRKEYIS